jgi:hypothetical protein
MNKISVISNNNFLEFLALERKAKFLFPESLIIHDGSINSWISLYENSIIVNELFNMNIKETFLCMARNKNKVAKRKNFSTRNYLLYQGQEMNEKIDDKELNYIVKMKNGEILKTSLMETTRLIEEKSVFHCFF